MTVSLPTSGILGVRLRLIPFTADMITDRYLDWLADDEVNKFSRRFGQARPTSAEAHAWLRGLSAEECVLAILDPELGHVGNIKFGPIDRQNARADLSILVGEHGSWNRGIGTEATYLASRHLFKVVGLNRVDAGSGNPAFIRMVEKLGWRREGLLRQHVRIGDRFVDWILVAQLAAEFHRRPELEA